MKKLIFTLIVAGMLFVTPVQAQSDEAIRASLQQQINMLIKLVTQLQAQLLAMVAAQTPEQTKTYEGAVQSIQEDMTEQMAAQEEQRQKDAIKAELAKRDWLEYKIGNGGYTIFYKGGLSTNLESYFYASNESELNILQKIYDYMIGKEIEMGKSECARKSPYNGLISWFWNAQNECARPTQQYCESLNVEGFRGMQWHFKTAPYECVGIPVVSPNIQSNPVPKQVPKIPSQKVQPCHGRCVPNAQP